MEYEKQRRSTNIEDRRGRGGGFPTRGGRSTGLGGAFSRGGGLPLSLLLGVFFKLPWMLRLAVIAGGVFLLLFTDMGRALTGGILGGQGLAPSAQTGKLGAPDPNDEVADRMAAVLGSTEDVWRALYPTVFTESYKEPALVLYDGRTPTACGTGSAAAGPFYCPADQRVYLDLRFFDEMRTRLGAGGDFAQAYVLAHEVGHHVQTLNGTSARAFRERQRLAGEGKSAEANDISVRQELQADCYAGVWAKSARNENFSFTEEDIREALTAAAAVGDDTLQRNAGRAVVPETFTHGSSEQRMRWFMTGFETGDPERCDTFSAARL